jgi:hypothetical protein
MRLVISRNAPGVASSASSLRPFFDQNNPAILNATSAAARAGSRLGRGQQIAEPAMVSAP